jgi:hypothetical protein
LINNFAKQVLPDLIVNLCPLGCNQTCGRIWVNGIIDHRIICECKCGHNKNDQVLVSVENPVPNTTHNTQLSSSEEVSQHR